MLLPEVHNAREIVRQPRPQQRIHSLSARRTIVGCGGKTTRVVECLVNVVEFVELRGFEQLESLAQLAVHRVKLVGVGNDTNLLLWVDGWWCV
jgi:hypothetical protein